MYDTEDTIVAVASPSGGAARGIVRLSGVKTAACAGRVFVGPGGSSGPSFDVTRSCVFDGALRLEAFYSPIPAEAYVWPDRRSYTGQPVVEFHTVGSTPVLEALTRELCFAGARPAGPGEFTLRAFLSGRIDLTQAEAVLGTIDAVSKDQLTAALVQLAGGLSRPLAALRDAILDLLAHLEAGLDFADEDLPFITSSRLRTEILRCAETVDRLTGRLAARHRAADLPKVVLAGAPNAGKSSLFNALAGDTAALVSKMPGTTRDYLTVDLNVGDFSYRLVDTAGVQAVDGGTIASAAAWFMEEQRRSADLVLLCVDASSDETPSLARSILGSHPSAHERTILVLTKCDKGASVRSGVKEVAEPVIHTSVKTRQGLAALEEAVREVLLADTKVAEGLVVTTAVRCADSFRRAAESLHRALRRLDETILREELVAADLRLALEEIGKIVGLVYTDDLLERVFSRFCIGK